MIEKTKQLVYELLKDENSGHGMDHINRVLELSLKFAENENCNKTIVALGALLHDVDDYKLFGVKNQKELINTNIILHKINAPNNVKTAVLDMLSKIGYSKRLNGIMPTTIEGMLVSDADMCDALGANGLLRTHKYSLKHGKDFFDKNSWPIESITIDKYSRKVADSSVCHMFEKILLIKNLMLTKAGKQEAQSRHNFVVDFLRQLFKEENAPDWEQYLNNFLQTNQ